MPNENIPPDSPQAAPDLAAAPLVFDDAPLGSQLYGDAACAGTPADALERWRLGLDRSNDCARAVGMLCVTASERCRAVVSPEELERCLRLALESLPPGEQSRSGRTTRLLAGLAAVVEERGRLEEAEALCRRVLDLCFEVQGPGTVERDAAARRLSGILVRTGRQTEAERSDQECSIKALTACDDDASLSALRQIAFDQYEKGELTVAEALCRHLQRKRHQPASTHCHVARLCLLTGRVSEARTEVVQAARHAGEAAPYVRPRIHFLNALLDLLEGKDIQPLLVRIRDEIEGPDASCIWLIQPVLDHLRPRLSPGHFALMTALAAALNSRSAIATLASNPEWQALPRGNDEQKPESAKRRQWIEIRQTVHPRCE